LLFDYVDSSSKNPIILFCSSFLLGNSELGRFFKKLVAFHEDLHEYSAKHLSYKMIHTWKCVNYSFKMYAFNITTVSASNVNTGVG